jgi:hypothetical protein
MTDQDSPKPFVIGFNGPPKSGKDTIASALADIMNHGPHKPKHPIIINSLARPMRAVAMELCGFPDTSKNYQTQKDQKQDLLSHHYGMPRQEGWEIHHDTIREFMIWLSEEVIKPRYGQDFWARTQQTNLSGIWEFQPLILVPDVGFKAEVEFYERNTTYYHVFLSRADCEWGNDSRRYVQPSKSTPHFITENNDTPEEVAWRILNFVKANGWELFNLSN